MPRCATGAGCGSSTGSAAAANASCATGHDTPACRAASAGVIPRSATSDPSRPRSRPVTRHRGGTCGSDSVNVLRGQASFPHFQRRFSHRTSTWSRPRRTSLGQVTTHSCARAAAVPHPGHAAAAGSQVATHTHATPPGPASTSMTCKPSTPNSADAVSWNTMPAAF